MDEMERRFEDLERRIKCVEDLRNRWEDQMIAMSARMNEAEKWQSGADQMLDSLNERVDENTDRGERTLRDLSGKLEAHGNWIAQQQGGISARASAVVQIGILGGVLATFVKLVFFHN